MILGYWTTRGLGQVPRYCLALSGLEWTQEDYTVRGDWEKGWDRSEWDSVKETKHGLDFPNLPYLIDGDVKLTQSNAVIRHIARRANLYGSSAAASSTIDMLLDQIIDIRYAIFGLIYCGGAPPVEPLRAAFESKAAGAKENLLRMIGKLSVFLGEKQWIVENTLSVADAALAEAVDQLAMMFGEDCLPVNLMAHRKAFFDLEKIKAFCATPAACMQYVNNPQAMWVGPADGVINY